MSSPVINKVQGSILSSVNYAKNAPRGAID